MQLVLSGDQVMCVYIHTAAIIHSSFLRIFKYRFPRYSLIGCAASAQLSHPVTQPPNNQCTMRCIWLTIYCAFGLPCTFFTWRRLIRFCEKQFSIGKSVNLAGACQTFERLVCRSSPTSGHLCFWKLFSRLKFKTMMANLRQWLSLFMLGSQDIQFSLPSFQEVSSHNPWRRC